jgi:hypothetical protein
MIEEMRGLLSKRGAIFPADLDALVEVGILSVLKWPGEHLGTTGLVFAGYGDADIFPSMVLYHSHGLVADKHLGKEVNREAVTHGLPAVLSAFAQTSMHDTFSLGFSNDAYITMMRAIEDGFRAFGDEVITGAGGDKSQIADYEAVIQKARKSISASIFNDAREKHALPLRRVLGVLPIDEMVELAETLIHLQSLKEKVTQPTESVGGPVDVAVITRREGLVWIKRKHFFSVDLNPRFLQRQANAFNDPDIGGSNHEKASRRSASRRSHNSRKSLPRAKEEAGGEAGSSRGNVSGGHSRSQPHE